MAIEAAAAAAVEVGQCVSEALKVRSANGRVPDYWMDHSRIMCPLEWTFRGFSVKSSASSLGGSLAELPRFQSLNSHFLDVFELFLEEV